MISVLTYDMLNVADINEILGLYKNGYVHIEPKVKKVSIIDLGVKKEEIIALSNSNFSINIFSVKFDLNQLLSINSDAFILWGSNEDLENLDYLIEKIKKLVEKKTIIGIGVGKNILEALLKNLGENEWQEYDNGIKENNKYKVYCLDDNNLDPIKQII